MVDKISWEIKSMTREHKLYARLEVNPLVNANYLVRKLFPSIEANLDTPVETLNKRTQERIRIQVKKRLFYKVRVVAKETMYPWEFQ